jgi:hypothetical protein
MKKYGSFVILENAAEWRANRGISVTRTYWLFGAKVQGLPDIITKENFPLIFKRIEAPDSHCGNTLLYISIDEAKAELISSIEEYIGEFKKKIIDAEDFLALCKMRDTLLR